MVDERKLNGKGAVKGIEESAVPVKNGALVVCLRQLAVDVLVFHALCVEPSVRTADTVLVHLPVGKGLLGGLGSGRFPRPGFSGLSPSLGRGRRFLSLPPLHPPPTGS